MNSISNTSEEKSILARMPKDLRKQVSSFNEYPTPMLVLRIIGETRIGGHHASIGVKLIGTGRRVSISLSDEHNTEHDTTIRESEYIVKRDTRAVMAILKILWKQAIEYNESAPEECVAALIPVREDTHSASVDDEFNDHCVYLATSSKTLDLDILENFVWLLLEGDVELAPRTVSTIKRSDQ